MTVAEAHVWITTYSAAMAEAGFPTIVDSAVAKANYAVGKLRQFPDKLRELDDALRQGSDIP